MSSESDFFDKDTQALMGMFPEARLTVRDRLPINLILTNAIITIQKSILNIEFSAEEIKEAVQGFMSMIPDSLKDERFNEEIEAARQHIYVDVRPVFCESKASVEWCVKRKVPITQRIETFDYFKVLHACFNLLMRKHMLLKIQPKEIMTGKKARGEEPEFEQELSET